MEDVRDNPHHQALAALIAELHAMGVDVDEAARRAKEGLEGGKSYAFRGGNRALAGVEALQETLEAYKYMLTV